MKYTFWDILILYCAVLAGIFAALELLIFSLFWVFIFYQRNLEFVSFMIRYYSALQLVNNPGTAVSFLCMTVSLIRCSQARGEKMPSGLRRMRRNLLIISLICSLLSLAHLLTWHLWPWVYW